MNGGSRGRPDECNDDEDGDDFVSATDPPDIISAQVLGGTNVG